MAETDVDKLRADLETALAVSERRADLLTEIHEYAHDRSTGPVVPDALWEIRDMAVSDVGAPAAARGPEEVAHFVPAKVYRSGKEAGLRAALSAIDGFEPDHGINTATARRLASAMRERVQARLDVLAEHDDATPDTARPSRAEGEA